MGKIPLEKFAAILDEDPVWKESVPQTLKDRIIKEVDLNNDGVIDYNEFLTLVKGRLSLRGKWWCVRLDHGAPGHGHHEPQGDVVPVVEGCRGFHHSNNRRGCVCVRNSCAWPAFQTNLLPRTHSRCCSWAADRCCLLEEPVLGEAPALHLDHQPAGVLPPHPGGLGLELSGLFQPSHCSPSAGNKLPSFYCIINTHLWTNVSRDNSPHAHLSIRNIS